MTLHRNANSTPSSRLLLVRRILCEGWSYAAAAEGVGVSERTVAKWVRRFRAGGVAALEDGSSRPGPAPHQTPPAAVALIRLLREQHGLPAWAIGRALRVPRSTVSAWLRRLGLNRPPAAPPVPVQRYEWPQAGDLLHVDIKPLGGITGVGHRVHGDRRQRPGSGWEYVHVAIEITAAWPTSRSSAISRPDLRRLSAACRGVVRRARDRRAARHERQRRRVLSRGVPRHVRDAQLRHLRTRAYTPRTNGKAERFIQTLLREWAYAAPYASSRERRQKLRPYVRYYNRQRLHASLDYQAPWSRLTSAA